MQGWIFLFTVAVAAVASVESPTQSPSLRRCLKAIETLQGDEPFDGKEIALHFSYDYNVEELKETAATLGDRATFSRRYCNNEANMREWAHWIRWCQKCSKERESFAECARPGFLQDVFAILRGGRNCSPVSETCLKESPPGGSCFNFHPDIPPAPCPAPNVHKIRIRV